MSNIDRVLFMGSKRLGLRVLEELHALSPDALIGVMTIDDTDDSRSAFAQFEHFATNHGLELHVAQSKKHSEQLIEELKPDLCLVAGWYWLVSTRILNAVRSGFIGIHNSLLPRFRGGSPLVWAVISGERKVGFSLFSFSSGMDDGPVWAQRVIPVREDDYISDILQKLEDKTIELLRDRYPSILSRGAEPTVQNHALATYCAQRTPADGNINWLACAQDVYNFIRAQSDPYPGAFTHLGTATLRIWKARLFDKTYYGTPGQIARITDDGVYVVCGDHRAIILEEVELGATRGRSSEIIKSTKSRLLSVAP